MEDKEKVIKTHLFAICARHPKADKESLLQIWLQEFDYIDEKEDYMIEFMEACRQVINDSSIYRMPSPDDIKHIIMGNISKPGKPLGEKPKVQKSVRELFRESEKILKKMNSCSDYKTRKKLKEEYFFIVSRMCTATNTSIKDSFRADMHNDSYVDLKLKKGKPIDKSHIGGVL